MSKRIEYIIDDIKEQYLEKDNNIPWIIGFSGGKDSTVVLTLVWRTLLAIREELGNNALSRQVYVVNNDTLVENPIITDYIVEVKKQAYVKEDVFEYMKSIKSDKYCLYSDEDDNNVEKFTRFISDTNSEGIYLEYYNHFDGYHRIYKIPELNKLIDKLIGE